MKSTIYHLLNLWNKVKKMGCLINIFIYISDKLNEVDML